jgi:hypothetical protein
MDCGMEWFDEDDVDEEERHICELDWFHEERHRCVCGARA